MKEPKPPSELVEWQTWFTKILACKPKSSMKECIKGTKRFASSNHRIVDSGPISPQESMELYVRSHWYKLIDTLSRLFPLTSGLFKKKALFEKIAIPYLKANPHYDFSFEKLGLTFADWIEKHYHRKDKERILTAARIDHAFRTIWSLPRKPAAMQFNQKTTLFLQPCVVLFETLGNFLDLREEIVRKKSSNTKAPIEIDTAEKMQYFMIFYDSKRKAFSQPLSDDHFALLNMFKEGASFEQARSYFRDKCSPSLIDLLSFDETLEEWKEKGLFYI